MKDCHRYRRCVLFSRRDWYTQTYCAWIGDHAMFDSLSLPLASMLHIFRKRCFRNWERSLENLTRKTSLWWFEFYSRMLLIAQWYSWHFDLHVRPLGIDPPSRPEFFNESEPACSSSGLRNVLLSRENLARRESSVRGWPRRQCGSTSATSTASSTDSSVAGRCSRNQMVKLSLGYE